MSSQASSFSMTLARTYRWDTENPQDQSRFCASVVRLFRTISGPSVPLRLVGLPDYQDVPACAYSIACAAFTDLSRTQRVVKVTSLALRGRKMDLHWGVQRVGHPVVHKILKMNDHLRVHLQHLNHAHTSEQGQTLHLLVGYLDQLHPLVLGVAHLEMVS